MPDNEEVVVKEETTDISDIPVMTDEELREWVKKQKESE